MYVAIEGIDTSGKSTQIYLLKNIYKNAIFTQEPSNSDFGKQIRELALFGNLNNTTQALLFMADRANHTKEILLPNKHQLIISDRSLISGIAYAQSLDFELLININLAISILPDLVIVLEHNEDILKERLSKKKSDNIEQNGIKYLLDIQRRILESIDRLNIEHIKIPCYKDEKEILNIICNKIDSKIL
ncbi:dTMP kinase [Helicobacter sp. 16-1353]|uniref:dTMP kinase n=1 Tax=Helicobacter sp. 16-1353 TaxID=2004996 RepID=UPI000DCCA759|nr:dTMP kinase [Helicobacter sp. 16-1353]RAX51491.1 dTMP kinase [Helicobacter sp. 16-1353]